MASMFCCFSLSHKNEKSPKWDVVFQKCSDMEKNIYKKGGGYHVLPSEIICLSVPKKFAGEPYCVSKSSGKENFHAYEGVASQFCRSFLSHSTKKIRKGFVFQNCSAMEKKHGLRGGYHVLPSRSFCMTVPKYSKWSLSVFRQNSCNGNHE